MSLVPSDMHADAGADIHSAEMRLSPLALIVMALVLAAAFAAAGAMAFREYQIAAENRPPAPRIAATGADMEAGAIDPGQAPGAPGAAGADADERVVIRIDQPDDASTGAPPAPDADAGAEPGTRDADTVHAQAAPAPSSDAPARPAERVDALSGSHVVQVGAFPSPAEAGAAWTRIEGRFADMLDGKAHEVERADLGAIGVFHRLRIGPFDSVEDARAYCAQLAERGQDCLAMRR